MTAALGQLARALGREREELRAQQRTHADVGARLGAELGALVDLERHAHLVALELDALDLADRDTGDPHLVAGLERADLGEVGVIGVAAADDRQAVGAEGAEHHQRDHGDADDADDDGIAFAEWLHCCIPRLITTCAADGDALRSAQLELGLRQDAGDRGNRDAAPHVAQVEVELAAVGRRVADLLQLDRQDLDRVLERGEILLRAEVLGQRVELLDVLAQRRPALHEQVGRLVGQVGDRVDRVEDRVAVVLEPGHELLERVDRVGQLLVAAADRVEHLAEVGHDIADELVAAGQRVGQRRGTGQQVLDVAALALERLDDLVGELVGVRGRERLEDGLETVEQHVEVERLLRAALGDRAACLERRLGAVGTLRQGDVALPDEVAELDRRVGVVGQRDVGVDAERHERLVALDDLDLLDRADGDTRDADVVTLGHTGHVVEDRLVLLAVTERAVGQRQRQDQRRDAGEGEEEPQLDEGAHGLAIDLLHRSSTAVPRRTGLISNEPMSGTLGRLHAERAAEQDVELGALAGRVDAGDAGLDQVLQRDARRGRAVGVVGIAAELGVRLLDPDELVDVGRDLERVLLRGVLLLLGRALVDLVEVEAASAAPRCRPGCPRRSWPAHPSTHSRRSPSTR